MPEGHDTTIEVCNIMSFVLYTQILKQSVLKPASPGITLNDEDILHLRGVCNGHVDLGCLYSSDTRFIEDLYVSIC